MKRILLALLLLTSATAHAGFLTGAVVGYAVGSDGKTPPPAASTTIVSDHDTIICKKYEDTQYCVVRTPHSSSFQCPYGYSSQQCLTPEQYAGDYGFKTLYKRGVQIIDNELYILMEVSK
jgi:hypothetical protein